MCAEPFVTTTAGANRLDHPETVTRSETFAFRKSKPESSGYFFTLNPSATRKANTVSTWSPCTSITPSRVVPPALHRVRSFLPSASRSIAFNGRSVTTVTVLPPRPLLSRFTRAVVPPCGTASFFRAEQTQALMGSPQSGHNRPDSEENTTRGALSFSDLDRVAMNRLIREKLLAGATLCRAATVHGK